VPAQRAATATESAAVVGVVAAAAVVAAVVVAAAATSSQARAPKPQPVAPRPEAREFLAQGDLGSAQPAS